MKQIRDKKKIFFIIHEMSAGGATRVVLNLLNGLEENIFDIHLVIFNNKGTLLPLVNPTVTIHNLNSSRVLLGTPKLIQLLLKEKPIIVFTGITHVNLMIATWIPFLKIFLKNTKFITREVSIPTLRAKYMKKSRRIDIFYKRLILRFDIIIAQSQYMKNDLATHYGIDVERVTVVNNPLDLITINKLLTEQGKQKVFSNNKINIVAVGMLRKEKAFERLLEVFVLLDDKYHLNIIGEGIRREMLEEKIENLKITTKVTLWGLQKNPYIYMKEANLVLLSSLYEGFPNVLLEANACGTFVIANACAGVGEEIIKDGINGVLVEENNIEAFAKAIENYAEIEHDEKKIIETTKRYDVQDIVKIYKNIFIGLKK